MLSRASSLRFIIPGLTEQSCRHNPVNWFEQSSAAMTTAAVLSRLAIADLGCDRDESCPWLWCVSGGEAT